jgi:hypothetical protein
VFYWQFYHLVYYFIRFFPFEEKKDLFNFLVTVHGQLPPFFLGYSEAEHQEGVDEQKSSPW